MCYSAAVVVDWAAFRKLFPSSRLALREFFNLYHRRRLRPAPLLRTPKAMDAQFAHPRCDEERQIQAEIAAWQAERETEIERDLFVLRKRLADAQRSLQVKVTKKAQEEQRIAGNKLGQRLAQLEALKRDELREGDSRIFPGQWFAPVLVIEDGEPVIRPMRYGCRPAGKPAFYDEKLSGTYNARRDNLRGFWKGQYGQTHGLLLVTEFFENVQRHAAEHRELQPGEKPENMVLRFRPEPARIMYVACVYSHWTPPASSDEPELWSFAAITDEPLPEVAAAGHDRTIVALRPENVEAWLTPQGQSLEELDALLEDKERPVYEYRMVA